MSLHDTIKDRTGGPWRANEEYVHRITEEELEQIRKLEGKAEPYDVRDTHKLSNGAAAWLFENAPIFVTAQVRTMDELLVPELKERIRKLEAEALDAT